MVYGIAGNISRTAIWSQVASVLRLLKTRGLPYVLHKDIAEGLRCSVPDEMFCNAIEKRPDVLLSFGGDGTLLRVAHYEAPGNTPILGINLGRLGFLAEVEAASVEDAIECLEAGEFAVEERLVLSVAAGIERTPLGWALNDVVLSRAESSGMIAMDVSVDGRKLDTYWADGLIVATPTGSTAYSLSAGGPIVTPGTDALVVTPIASHSLTVRPVVLPGSTVIELRMAETTVPFVLAVDGVRRSYPGDTSIRVQRAEHTVKLVRLSGHHYFQTLRSKLSWGAGPQQQA